MKSNKKFILEDVQKSYDQNLDYDSILKEVYVPKIDDSCTIKWKVLSIVSVFVMSIMIGLMVAVAFLFFHDGERNKNDYSLSSENREYMISECDEFDDKVKFVIYINDYINLYLYSGKKDISNKQGIELYFYIIDVTNDSIPNIQLIIEEQTIVIEKDDQCGILAIRNDGDNANLVFDIIVDGLIKSYALDSN